MNFFIMDLSMEFWLWSLIQKRFLWNQRQKAVMDTLMWHCINQTQKLPSYWNSKHVRIPVQHGLQHLWRLPGRFLNGSMYKSSRTGIAERSMVLAWAAGEKRVKSPHWVIFWHWGTDVPPDAFEEASICVFSVNICPSSAVLWQHQGNALCTRSFLCCSDRSAGEPYDCFFPPFPSSFSVLRVSVLLSCKMNGCGRTVRMRSQKKSPVILLAGYRISPSFRARSSISFRIVSSISSPPSSVCRSPSCIFRVSISSLMEPPG